MANPEHIKWLLEGVERWNARREQQDFDPDFAGANIYEEFQRVGKLDDDGYIPLTGFNLRGANFRESCLCTPGQSVGADLRHANLWWANLQGAQLTNSKLDDAVLCGTRFDNANLHGACLRRTKMGSTGFPETDLSQADLTDVQFENAYLRNANLSCATLVGTDLTAATLTGADLGWSRPWEAKLYRESESTSGSSTNTDHARRISCVADLIKESRVSGKHLPDDVLYFRGEISNTWELRPAVMRKHEPNLRSHESEMLLDLMSRRPADFNDTTSALSQWVLAQHHGLKTRLLDVTRNPLVALFSACESGDKSGRVHVFSVPKELVKPFNSDSISIITNFSKLSRAEQNLLVGWSGDDIGKREPEPQFKYIYEHAMRCLYHLIRQEKPFFEEQIDPRDFFRVLVVEPQQSFERVRAQSGAFLISAFHERLERSEILKWNSGIPIYDHSMLEVPNENKQYIRDELRLLNITRETLFPSIDEAAKAVTQRHSK